MQAAPPQRVYTGNPVDQRPVKQQLQREETKYNSKAIKNYARRLASEFLGTLILTWSHAGVALSLANTAVELEGRPDQHMNIAADAFASGLTLTGLIYALEHISGAHLNPGVSLAFVFHGDMNPKSLLPYITAQIAGGIAAAGILDAVFINDDFHGNLGANRPLGGFTVLSAFWMEFIGSIFLQLAILGTASRKNMKEHSALAAGLTIGAMIAYLAPYGGGSMNPARSIGPGILASNPNVRGATWIYVASPFAASFFTGFGLKWLAPVDKKESQEEPKTATESFRQSVGNNTENGDKNQQV